MRLKPVASAPNSSRRVDALGEVALADAVHGADQPAERTGYGTEKEQTAQQREHQCGGDRDDDAGLGGGNRVGDASGRVPGSRAADLHHLLDGVTHFVVLRTELFAEQGNRLTGHTPIAAGWKKVQVAEPSCLLQPCNILSSMALYTATIAITLPGRVACSPVSIEIYFANRSAIFARFDWICTVPAVKFCAIILQRPALD